MKRLIPILLLLLSSSKLFSQHASLSVSNEFKIKEGDDGYENQTISHSVFHNNSFYTVTNSRPSGKWLFTKLYDVQFTITATQFDKDMKKIKEVELEDGKKDFGPLMPSLLSFNDKLYIAYFKGVDKSSFNLYLAAIDENDLSLGEPKTICTLQQENVGIFKIMPIIDGGLVYFTVSPDNARLLVACKSAPGKIQTIVLDDHLNLLKRAEVSVNSSTFDIPSALLTNDNGACLVLHSKEGSSILGIGPDGKKTEIRYNANGNLSSDKLRVQLAQDGKSIFIFSTATELDLPTTLCNGFTVSRYDAGSFKLIKTLNCAFTPELIQTISERGGGYEHRKNYFMYNFTPQLLEIDNENFAIIGSPENRSQDSYNSTPNMQGQTQTITVARLNVGPVVVFFPDKNGKLLDQVVIPREIALKKTAGSGTGAIQIVQSPKLSSASSGLIASLLGDDIVIIYTDNTKNLSRSVDEKITESKSAGDLELAEALINKDRKLEYRKLIGESNLHKTTFYLGDVIPTNSSSFVFPVGKEGEMWSTGKTIYTNWCFLDLK
jgi:hypothetical protein